MKRRSFQKQIRMKTLFFLSLIFFSFYIPVKAEERLPDLDRRGEIHMTMKDRGEIVSGGTMTLYRVGDVYVEDGNYMYVPTIEFEGSNLSLEDLSDHSLPGKLWDYAEKEKIRGVTREIGEDGIIRFPDLSTGLYMCVQKKAAEGYYKLPPFFITLPDKEGEEWSYVVDALPKLEVGLSKKPGEEVPGQDIPDETEPGGENGGTGGGTRLPQTGQMNWPIPFLLIGGVCIFAAGWSLYRKKDGR